MDLERLKLTDEPDEAEKGVHVTRAVTIERPIEDLYAFWHDPTNLPQVIQYIKSVQVTGEKRAHWTLKLPGGMHTDFEVETYEDIPNEHIAWRTVPDAQMQSKGEVRFKSAPAGRGSEVHLTVDFDPPGGKIGEALMKLFNEAPSQYIGQYLREFKAVMEAGEVPTNKGQSSGRGEEDTQ